MIKIIRTDGVDPDFRALVKQLDADLALKDGQDHAFYLPFNNLDKIQHVVMAYDESNPAGCGALKKYSADTVEIKRMFVLPDHRRMGIAATVLAELERWAEELSYKRCILETSIKLPEAIGLYRKKGYQQIPNYRQYSGVKNSVCFGKIL
jgi:putative acetyltransferase